MQDIMNRTHFKNQKNLFNTHLEAKKSIRDLITSCIGMFGPGCEPIQLPLSSGITITGGEDVDSLPT